MARPNVKSTTGFGNNIVAVNKYRNKFNYLGFVVLKLSKLLMYQFVYDILYKTIKPENLRILLTDTDSVIIDIKLEPKETIAMKLEMIDKHMDQKANVCCFFKDERSEKIISKYIGQRCIAWNFLIISIQNLRQRVYQKL